MRKSFSFVILIVCVIFVLSACGTQQPSSEFKDPTVKLNQVQVQSYFEPPWAGWPAPPPTPLPALPPFPGITGAAGTIRVPMVLAFIWDINNPNEQNVTLEQMKFTVEFEAAPLKPNEYFALSTPNVYEKQTIPAKATNQLRVVTIIDSSVVPGTLAVAYGQRMASLGLSGAALVQNWWVNVSDFKFGIKVTNGTADFKSASGQSKLVTFEGKFPTK